MLKLIFKVSMLLAIAFSGTLQAQAQQIDKLEAELKAQEQPIVSNDSVQGCPQDFYSLPLFPNAKYCQLFSEKPPASMSYFAISDQQTAKAFYLEQLGQAEDENMLKGRIILQYANGQKVIVISKDGQGSQIDILIKSEENI